jgi:HSP20 family molecular chaperone IbpA
MIGGIGESIGNAIFENIGRAAGRVQENKPLPADLLESEDAYLVVFDAPGATASDLQVRYVEDRVEVRLDRFREFYDEFEMRYPGRGLALDGSVTLPEDAVVDADEATATLKTDGTLHVRVPKAAEPEAHVADDDEDHAAADEADGGDAEDHAA